MSGLVQFLLLLWLAAAVVYVLADATLALLRGRGGKDERIGG